MAGLANAGRLTAVTLDEFDITGYYNEYKFKRDAALIDVTPFGNRIAIDLAGIQKASVELKGFYNSDHDTEIHSRFGADDDVYLSLCPKGYRSLYPAIMLPSVITKYEVSAKAKDATEIDSEFSLRGVVDDGVQLLSPKTVLTGASGVSAVYDAGALVGSTVAGCAAQLHVWSLEGTSPTLDVVIEHSDTPSPGSWSTLMTFSQADVATGSVERQQLDYGNTVKQCIRARWTLGGTGTPKARVLLPFARSVDYDS